MHHVQKKHHFTTFYYIKSVASERPEPSVDWLVAILFSIQNIYINIVYNPDIGWFNWLKQSADFPNAIIWFMALK